MNRFYRIGRSPTGAQPQAPREKLRTRFLPARLPHAIQLCIRCGERPAGFWVSRPGAKTVRRPRCLSCCEGLDPDCRVIAFDAETSGGSAPSPVTRLR